MIAARLAVIALTLALAMGPTPGLAQGAAIALAPAQNDPDAPVEVTADALRVDRETGNAVFTGNVLVVQGALRLSAREVEIFYDEETETSTEQDQGIREVIATGDVVLVNGPDTAEGQRAVFRPREDRVVMTGNVLLIQGRTAISGDRLVVNLETGQGTVEGRVKTVLQPRGGTGSE